MVTMPSNTAAARRLCRQIERHSTTFSSQFPDGLLQLLTETDGVSLRQMHYPVECIGDEEDGQQAVVGQFHLRSYLPTDASVLVDTISAAIFLNS